MTVINVLTSGFFSTNRHRALSGTDGQNGSATSRTAPPIYPEEDVPSTARPDPAAPRPCSTWAAGTVDGWDGHVRPVLAHRLLAPESNELRILVCHAQNRVLLPLVEEARISLIELIPDLLRKEIELDYFREQARSDHRVRNGLPAAPLAELEIGDLARAARLLVLPTDQQNRLRTLNKARNHLSHLQPLSQERLVAVTEALTTDWVADDES
ncbi:hypothetical protein [Streptomyces sp. PanSC19]|uniref:hypothetical protein n=1 Tax=Streptomyces sp. PanSC19 TaxID=1520455 RepID=UPI0011CD5D18|nr:hypothetical protein [Streptomyces sp. PanSC19]